MKRNLLRFGLSLIVLLVSVVTKASEITLTYSLGTITAEGTLPEGLFPGIRDESPGSAV